MRGHTFILCYNRNDRRKARAVPRYGQTSALITRKNPTAQLARCRAQEFGYSDHFSLAVVSFWVLKAVSVNMPLANKTQMMLMNILMMTFAFSMKDEEDEDYEPRVEVRRILTNIPKFPDISAFGPKSIGALKLLNDWIDDDVGEWLVTRQTSAFQEWLYCSQNTLSWM